MSRLAASLSSRSWSWTAAASSYARTSCAMNPICGPSSSRRRSRQWSWKRYLTWKGMATSYTHQVERLSRASPEVVGVVCGRWLK